jgi:hypothetical protein
MKAHIVPGAICPDYELSDHRRTHRTLSELHGGDRSPPEPHPA